MIIQNVDIFTEEKRFVHGAIVTEGEKIREIIYAEDDIKTKACEQEVVIDGEGCYAIPGLIDLHFHGCNGFDLCDGTRQALEEISKYEAAIGVTAICPAVMTLPVPRLIEILGCAAAYRAEQSAYRAEQSAYRAEQLADRTAQMADRTARLSDRMARLSDRAAQMADRTVRLSDRAERLSDRTARGAELVGINMEGPFISESKRGAQDLRYITPCNAELFRQFQQAAGGLVKLVGIAPEEGDIESFISAVKDSVKVALAHTGASYEKAMEAIALGAEHAVHFYNAMSGFHHRDPGVVGAVFESKNVTAELICDGLHVHPLAVRTAFRMLGAERLVLVSDSIRATGLPDGVYELGGAEVEVKGRKATLLSDESALAGSVTSLPDCMRYCVQNMGISLEDAVACATLNPAKVLGIYEDRGTLTSGKIADIVLLNRDLSLKAVILRGERL